MTPTSEVPATEVPVAEVAGVALAAIADAVGTPTYVYDAPRIRTQVAALSAALAGTPHDVHYALKANATLGVLQVLRAAGVGADVVSGGELVRALRAGFAPSAIVFDGPGKTDEELRLAVATGLKLVNVESAGEAARLAAIAEAAGRVVAVGLRVNPEVTVENFHRYISTGEAGDKFGIPVDDAPAVARSVAGAPSLRLAGLHMHVGSQLHAFGAFERGIERLADLLDALRRDGIGGEVAWLDIGGGLPVAYAGGDVGADLAAYADVVRRAHARTGCRVLVEPGRLLVAEAGVLLSRVVDRKRSGGREYVVVDAGMNDLIRPPLYGAHHGIASVGAVRASMVADVVGPICESGDFFARGRAVPAVVPGDLLVVRTAGAYGAVMGSNYNARPRAAEVLADGGRWAVVRRRETMDDLLRLEPAAPDWRTA